MLLFKEYNSEAGLIFVHIPKTAGTTLRKALQKSPSWIIDECYDNSPHALASLASVVDDVKKVLKNHIIFGHITHEMWRQMSKYIDLKSAQLCTVLRHPADIIFSNYFYVKMLNKDQTWGRQRGRLEGFVDSYISKKYSPYFTYLPRPESDLHTYISKNFVWIGLSENLDATVHSSILSSSTLSLDTRVNESFYDEPITESLIAKIKETYPLELELFEIVKHHYEGKKDIDIPLHNKRSNNIDILLSQIKSLNEMLEIERERVAAEREVSRELRTWAERTQKMLAVEKETSENLHIQVNDLRKEIIPLQTFANRFYWLYNIFRMLKGHKNA